MDIDNQIEETTEILENELAPENFSLTDESLASTNSPAEIIENLQVPVSIELARLNFSIRELGSLRSEQILELNKKPGELVDLVVSGKIIGQGELVDIEGEIGVRIASLVK